MSSGDITADAILVEDSLPHAMEEEERDSPQPDRLDGPGESAPPEAAFAAAG